MLMCTQCITAQVSFEKVPPIKNSKEAWKRLLLQLSSTYLTVVNENQVNLDSSLMFASHSLGLSRISLIAEGFPAADIISKSKWLDESNPREGITILKKLQGRQHAVQLLLLGAYYAFQPNSYEKYKDSVNYFLNRAIIESNNINDRRIKYNALCLKIKMLIEAGNFSKANPIFTVLVNESEKSGGIDIEAKAYAYWGLYAAYSPVTTAKRIAYLKKAVQLYQVKNNVEGEINSLTNIGYLYVASYQLDNAYDVFLKSYRLAQSIKFPYTQYNTENLTMVTKFQSKFGEPFKYILETVNTAVAAQDSIGWGYFFGELQSFYEMDSGKEKEALQWGMKAVDRMLVTKQSPIYLSVLDIVTVLVNSKRTAEAQALLKRVYDKQPPVTPTDKLIYFVNLAYIQMQNSIGQYHYAKKNLSKADSIEKIIEITSGISRRSTLADAFGRLYFETGDYKKAKQQFLHYVQDVSTIHGDISNVLYDLKKLVYIDSIQKNQTMELIHLKQIYKLTNDNFQISKTMQEQELQVKYNTEAKESQITLLNQQSKLEQANLNQANLARNVTGGGVALSLVILVLLYRQNQLKQKNNDIVTQKNTLLRNLLNEKEWLLKEVHHRVKNNLHTVICLLESQAAYLENDALKAVESSQHRIFAMSLIHQRLYQSTDIQTIDMGVYLPEFIMYLKESFGAPVNINFQQEIESLRLDLSQAIPLALIVNEAVTNAIKYAFPDEKTGHIKISLLYKNDLIWLLIEDDGIGMPTNINPDQSSSLGLELIKGLTNDLNGSVEFLVKKGTQIILKFTKAPFNIQNEAR